MTKSDIKMEIELLFDAIDSYQHGTRIIMNKSTWTNMKDVFWKQIERKRL